MGIGIAHACGHEISRACEAPTIFAVLSPLLAVLSLCASGAAVYISMRAFIDSKRPVLVFERMEGAGWMVKNVGNGPALNVVFSEGDAQGKWIEPFKLASISKDSSFQFADLAVAMRLGAVYTDFDGNLYSSDCTNYITKIRKGQEPDDWLNYDASKIRYYNWPH